MASVAVVADSGCDLPPDILDRYQIITVPLIARFGEEELYDTQASRAEFWQRYDIRQPPHSSGPSLGAWTDAYRQSLQRADEAIVLTLTGKHSGTFNTASLAASEFDGRVKVFDSWSLSLGEGLLTLRAAQLAQDGLSRNSILGELESWRHRLRVLIVLDTLEAVQRGGRLATFIAAIKRVSTVLSIKPLISIDMGDVRFDGAVRSLKRGITRIADDVEGVNLEAVAVAHTCAADLAKRLADVAANAAGFPRQNILIAEAGPALAVHAGPRALGMAYIPARV